MTKLLSHQPSMVFPGGSALFKIIATDDTVPEKNNDSGLPVSPPILCPSYAMPAGKKASHIKADIRHNRLIFTFCGWIRKKDLDSIYTDVRFCVADLKPGFHVITDLSECTFGSLNCLATFRKIMAYLIEKEAGQIVRITKKSSLIHKQIMNISARIHGYKPVYVSSMAEAESFLAADGDSTCLYFGLQQVAVSLASEDGTERGVLTEICESDCLVEGIASAGNLNQDLVLSFSLQIDDTQAEEFELSGKVATFDEHGCRIHFLHLDEDDRQRLRRSLARQAQLEP